MISQDVHDVNCLSINTSDYKTVSSNPSKPYRTVSIKAELQGGGIYELTFYLTETPDIVVANTEEKKAD